MCPRKCRVVGRQMQMHFFGRLAIELLPPSQVVHGGETNNHTSNQEHTELDQVRFYNGTQSTIVGINSGEHAQDHYQPPNAQESIFMKKSQLFPKDHIGGIGPPKKGCPKGNRREQTHVGKGIKQGDALPQLFGNELGNGRNAFA